MLPKIDELGLLRLKLGQVINIFTIVKFQKKKTKAGLKNYRKINHENKIRAKTLG